MDAKSKKKYMKAGLIARKALENGKEACESGVSYISVVDKVEKTIDKYGARPAFPVNISVNEVGAHYAPYPGDGKTFKDGDIVKIDVGVHLDGYIADNALTVEVGTNRHESLIKAAEESLDFAIKSIRPGIKTKEIGKNIQSVIKSRGFKPISNLSGHAIERYSLHSGTSIPNVPKGRGKIKKGMVLAIEPFATDGKGKVRNGNSSKILKLERPRNLDGVDKEFYNWVEERFHNLPFTERWCRSYGNDYKYRLKRLIRFNAAIVYPILVEIKGGLVTQREHTVIVTSKGAKVITN
ncbi:MAG: type II methionyl aminopeptidase [Candidatus Saliniplasma sp.]